MASVYSRPSVSGIMRENPGFRDFGIGLTDRIFLLGHNDGLKINDPYQVVSMSDAIQALGAESLDSPLTRALFEAYYSGAKDIWLVAVAPMEEYESDIASRDQTWYQTYYDRLEVSYGFLKEWGEPQIIVPIEAVYHDSHGVDFLTQLADHCNESFDLTGLIRLGILGSRILNIDSAVLTEMVDNDTRPQTLGANGKFVLIVIGEGVFSFRNFTTAFTAPLATCLAAEVAQLPVHRGAVYINFRAASNMTTPEVKQSVFSALSEAKLNPAIRNTLGQRGRPYSIVLATDNTVGSTGTDWWNLSHIRLASRVIEGVKRLGNRYMGTIQFGTFKREVGDYLRNLMTEGFLKDCQYDIRRDPTDIFKVLVDIVLYPWGELRQISFIVEVGPEQ